MTVYMYDKNKTTVDTPSKVSMLHTKIDKSIRDTLIDLSIVSNSVKVKTNRNLTPEEISYLDSVVLNFEPEDIQRVGKDYQVVDTEGLSFTSSDYVSLPGTSLYLEDGRWMVTIEVNITTEAVKEDVYLALRINELQDSAYTTKVNIKDSNDNRILYLTRIVESDGLELIDVGVKATQENAPTKGRGLIVNSYALVTRRL